MSWTAVVLNDSSGTGDCAEAARRVQELLTAAGREVRVTVARGGGQLKPAMEEAVREGCSALVAGGGDGTISTAASAVVDRDIPLGILPLGTLNHFAKDLGIPLELDEAVKVILNGTKCRVDVGEVNGRLFLNNSSLGVYPAIVRLRDRYRAGGWGKWIAALWAALAVLRRNPFMAVRIKTEGETIVRRTPFVFVGNNEYRMSGLHAGSRDSMVSGKLAAYVLNAGDGRAGPAGVASFTQRSGAGERAGPAHCGRGSRGDQAPTPAGGLGRRGRVARIAYDLPSQARQPHCPRPRRGLGLPSWPNWTIFQPLKILAVLLRSFRW